jgi:hypothetical protein
VIVAAEAAARGSAGLGTPASHRRRSARLHDLHVGIHRAAEGRDGGTWAIHNRIALDAGSVPPGEGDRVLQKTPYTFDVSVWEFLWPFIAGATWDGAPGGHRSPNYLVKTMRESG